MPAPHDTYAGILDRAALCRKKAIEIETMAGRMPDRYSRSVFLDRARLWHVSAAELENLAALMTYLDDVFEKVT